MIRRVFLITSNQIKVFEFDQKHLSSSYEFKNHEEGLKEFELYLTASQAISSQVLVELLEEDFQRDKIPHVFGSDRQALIQRQITRHYRDNKHTHAHIIGRDSAGRRDDEVLLTSISNPEPVDIWMEIFDKHNVPITGIWSLPLLSEELIKKISQKHENILLVSRQMRSTLRESCFRGDRLLLSRQVKLDQGVRVKNIPAAYVSDGVEQIHKYLSNQRIIPFGSKLDVYCLIPENVLTDARESYQDSNILGYHFITIESLFKQFGITSDHGHQADVLFAFLCSRKASSSDHYHPGGEKNAYYTHLFEKAIFYTSTIGSLVLLTVAAFLVVNGLEKRQDMQVIQASTERLQRTYNETYIDYEAQIEGADLVRETFFFSERIKNESRVSPEDFLIPLGEVLGRSQFSLINLTSLVWEKFHGNELETLRKDVWRKTTPNLTEYSEYPYNEAEMDDKIPVVTLGGTMRHDDLPYRETVKVMQDFVKALQNMPEVKNLFVSKTPVDIRVDSQFSDQSGTDTELHIKSNEAYLYEITLLLGPSEPDDIGLEVADGS